MNFSKLQEIWSTEDPGMLQSMGSQGVGHDLAAEQQPQQQFFGRKNITEVPLTAGIIELQLKLHNVIYRGTVGWSVVLL